MGLISRGCRNSKQLKKLEWLLPLPAELGLGVPGGGRLLYEFKRPPVYVPPLPAETINR